MQRVRGTVVTAAGTIHEISILRHVAEGPSTPQGNAIAVAIGAEATQPVQWEWRCSCDALGVGPHEVVIAEGRRHQVLHASRDQRQRLIAEWTRAAFGVAEATGLPQRGLRLLEEAIEAFQACGGNAAIAHELVTYVFDREPGVIGQELGGVSVTVLALAAAAGLSADEEECREVHRVLSKPVGEFTQRNARKNAAGFKIP